MLDKIRNTYDLVNSGLLSFRDTDLDQVQYLSIGLALGAGLFLILALAYKLLFGKNKSRRPYSGHAIPKKYQQGNISKLVCLFPKFLLGGATFFLLLALADPYLPKSKIEENIESIEWIHLIDASPSKGWRHEDTNISTAEFCHRFFMKFLEMRKDQNDRSSLWYFAASPTMVEDFIMDHDIYMMQAEDMPFVVTDGENPFLPENDKDNRFIDIIAPKDRIKIVYNGGGTDLVAGLNAVIRHFDLKGDKKIKQKALLVETDMAIDSNPDIQFKELQKRKIKVYILHTKPNMTGELQGNSGAKLLNAELFRKQVEQYGFKLYSISDPRSLDNAYRDINRLEKSPVKITRHILRVFIYQRPLLVGVVLLFLSVVSGLITERWTENP